MLLTLLFVLVNLLFWQTHARLSDEQYELQLEKDWKSKMHDFIPNDYLTIVLQKNDAVDFYAHIVSLGSIRGAFFTEPDKRVSINVFSPTG